MVSKTSRSSQSSDPVVPSRLPCGRAAWCGQLQFGNDRLPVKAFPAAVTSQASPLCQVHAGCGRKICQHKICPQHGTLTPEEIGKAFVYGPEQIIPIETAELAALNAEDEKLIRLKQFVAEPDVDPCLLSGRSFYLVPAHQAAGVDYGAVVLAMQATAVWGVGDVVLNGRRQPAAVHVQSRRLVLFLLHRPVQRRSCPVLDDSSDAVPARRVTALKRVIAAGHSALFEQEWSDDWETRLAALIERKRSGPRGSARRGSTGRGSVRRNPTRNGPVRRGPVAPRRSTRANGRPRSSRSS